RPFPAFPQGNGCDAEFSVSADRRADPRVRQPAGSSAALRPAPKPPQAPLRYTKLVAFAASFNPHFSLRISGDFFELAAIKCFEQPRMRFRAPIITLTALLIAAAPARPDVSYLIDTFAGSDLVGDDGPATSAQLSNSRGVVLDRQGNLYVSDT